MTGGGGRDRYLLVSGDGFDHIVDFDFQNDVLLTESAINGTLLVTAAQVLAMAVEIGGNTVINLGGSNAITLEGTPLANLTVANFMVVTELDNLVI
ncbi:hypothetical protein STHU_20400 [Allostella humosa]|nr:hypothetical protein [Stella humosa]BBK31406.1 hypothetical protein STHU_20400 [Stella humosa]